ncbi:hypothetical protein Q5752_006356 [Cryptotrichosporon argae]
MPPKLGQYDSFNSSSATVVPDRSLRASSTFRGMMQYLNDSDGPDEPSPTSPHEAPEAEAGPSQATEPASQLALVAGSQTFSRLLGDPAGAPHTDPEVEAPSSQSSVAQPRSAPASQTPSQGTKYWKREDSFVQSLEEMHGPGAGMGLLHHGGFDSILYLPPLRQTASGNLDIDAIINDSYSPPVTSISPAQIAGGTTSPLTAGVTSPPDAFPDFRPSSAASNHSSVSAHSADSHAHSVLPTQTAFQVPRSAGPTVHSFLTPQLSGPDAFTARDYDPSDYSTTDISEDMDTDDVASLHSVNGDEAAQAGAGFVYRQPDAGVSVGGLAIGDAKWMEGPSLLQTGRRSGAAGASAKKRVIVDEDDEASREAKLEHRRDINRRSAQKHRKRRKEEVEGLHADITARDRTIAKMTTDNAALWAENKLLREQLESLHAAMARK